jgi:Leu/Phe-tRNA-protein transferase
VRVYMSDRCIGGVTALIGVIVVFCSDSMFERRKEVHGG